MKRLVYSPSVKIWVKTDFGIIDLSPYVTECRVQRKVNDLSSLDVVFRNPKVLQDDKPRLLFTQRVQKDGNIGPVFHPMDPITVILERIAGKPIQVFTGYCDTVPYVQLFPGTARLTASCTLKRLNYTYFDPGLPFVKDFMGQYGWLLGGDGIVRKGGAGNDNAADPTTTDSQISKAIKSTNVNDSSIGYLLYAVLNEIGGWDNKNIYVQSLPNNIAQIVGKLFDEFAKNNKDVNQEIEKFVRDIIGNGDFGKLYPNASTASGGIGNGGGYDSQGAQTYAATRKGTIGFAVVDSGGNLIAKYNENDVFYGASITKAMVMVAIMRKYNALNNNQRNLLSSMIKDYNNSAANTLYSFVNADAINKVASDANMSNFQLQTKSDGYVLGGSQVSASDMARLFAKILSLVPSQHRSYAQQLMNGIRGEGRFGVVAIDNNAYGKTGWNPGPGVAHSGGNSSNHGIAVMVGNNPGDNSYNISTNNEVARRLMTPPATASTASTTSSGLAPNAIEQFITQASNTYHVDKNIIREVMRQESNFDQNSVSSAGAIGLMQLMPATARGLGVNPHDAEQNVMGGAKYLASLLNSFNNNIPLTLAGYNAGPGNVSNNAWRNMSETVTYVQKICAKLGITSPV